MLSKSTKDNVGAFCREFHGAFLWYIYSYIEAYEKVKSMIKFLCLHYDDGVVARVMTFKKVMNCVTLFTKLQTEWDKQRQNANIQFLKIKKSTSRSKNKKKKIDDLSEMTRLRKIQIAHKTDEDFDILYSACIVFALGYLAVPLLQVTLVLFFPFWVMVFIFTIPPILITAFIITSVISVVESMTRMSAGNDDISMISFRIEKT